MWPPGELPWRCRQVLATTKNSVLVLIGVAFLGEAVTRIQALGYTTSLVGFIWYNRIKMTQISRQEPGPPEVKSAMGKSEPDA